MLKRLLDSILRFVKHLSGNPFHGVKLSNIREEDLCFDPDIERMIRECELYDAFRSFGSLEEYNKDFVIFFKSHRSDFLLDYTHKDGHFRV